MRKNLCNKLDALEILCVLLCKGKKVFLRGKYSAEKKYVLLYVTLMLLQSYRFLCKT